MRGRSIAVALAVFALLAVLRVASAPPWPDDWDGIGFVASIARFDLDHFAPHPPGYPVYVALLRVAALGVRDPVAAANVVAVASGLACSVLVALAGVRARWSAERTAWVVAFTAVVPLAWRAATAIGSEAPALALACAALAGAATGGRRGGWWMGAAIGLGIGVRLSWAPLFLALFALAPRDARARTTLVALGAILVWAIPFVAIVGPSHLAELVTVHAAGHFHTWGGTTLSEPGPLRLAYLARDLFVDGIGVDADALGIAIGGCALVLLVLGLQAWREHGWAHARLALLLVPYAAWIAFGQNLRQQPRHALPLVVPLAAALALSAATSRHARQLGSALLVLIAVRTAEDASARRAVAPPGAQLVALVRDLPESDRVAVFGGPSARFFELPPPRAGAQTVGSIADARLALGRVSSFPRRILVTDELDGLDSVREQTTLLARLCRPERLDRRAPCLDVYDWRPPFLPPRP